MTEASPVGVWDATSSTWPGQHQPARWAWALAHLADPVHIYRVEFFEGPAAMVYRFALNEHGQRHLDSETGDVAMLPPERLTLDELPPAELLSGAP